MRRNLMVFGALGSFLVAGLHFALGTWVLFLPSEAAPAFRFFGGPDVEEWGGGPTAAATFALTALFVAFALYALAAAGRFRPLPLQRPLTLGVGLIYTFRGLALVPEFASLALNPGVVPPQMLLFSAVSLAIGLMHLLGLRRVGA